MRRGLVLGTLIGVGALSLVVFIVLLSGLGAASLLESREAWKRAAGVALLLLIPAQYFFFL